MRNLHGRYGKLVGIINDDQIKLIGLCEKRRVHGNLFVSDSLAKPQRFLRRPRVKAAQSGRVAY